MSPAWPEVDRSMPAPNRNRNFFIYCFGGQVAGLYGDDPGGPSRSVRFGRRGNRERQSAQCRSAGKRLASGPTPARSGRGPVRQARLFYFPNSCVSFHYSTENNINLHYVNRDINVLFTFIIKDLGQSIELF